MTRNNTLDQRIQNFYDESSGVWEAIWGEHMHHGFYGWDGKARKERRQAQIDLVEALLHFAQVRQVDSVLDIGCGIGGSSLYFVEMFGATATGITLSPVQVQRAQERARVAGLADRTDFRVANALDLPFEDTCFDLVWSLESGEHMPDKTKFLQESYRVLKPGGTLILATWCHRSITGSFNDLAESGSRQRMLESSIEHPATVPLTVDEIRHLKAIYELYHLPYVISLLEYEEIVRNLGFQNLRSGDWSIAVAPFWQAVIESALSWEGIVGVLRSGWQTIRGSLALGLMRQGYERGLIRFGVVVATKAS